MPAPGEADYRYYNSNLQAPYMKCKQITMDSFTVNEWQPSGICTYNGYKPVNTIHTWTTTDLPCMNNSDMSGELTLYVKNAGAQASAVILAVLTKAGSVWTYSNYYQALGNMTGVGFSNANQTSVTGTFDPAVEVRWIFRGF